MVSRASKSEYKAARLTHDERLQICGHGTAESTYSVRLAVRSSDGSGYDPNRGEEIPIEERIIRVADVCDALVSDRPYGKGTRISRPSLIFPYRPHVLAAILRPAISQAICVAQNETPCEWFCVNLSLEMK